MNWVGDTVPYDPFWGKRDKFVHTVGPTGAFKFVPQPNAAGFTGVFADGADYGIIRFSAAGPYDPTKPVPGNFDPGFAIKILRDGIPSANVVGSAPTTDTWNPFTHDYSNIIPWPTGEEGDKFRTATAYP